MKRRLGRFWMGYYENEGASAEVKRDIEFENRWNKKIKREVFGLQE